MHTPAHALLAAALLARPGAPRRNAAALAGGVLPDLSLFVMVGWERLVAGHDWDRVFQEDFRAPFWQAVFATDNSIPLYALLLAVGLALGPGWLPVFAAAALLHLACDLPLHNEDARPHFEPFTDWVFRSPVSYWDPARHGGIVGPLELALCALCCLALWRRFGGAGARAGIAAALTLQTAPYLTFPMIFT